MKKIEVYFIRDDYTWESGPVSVPDDIYQSQSEDAFQKWLHFSDEGKKFVSSWDKHVICVTVYSWDDQGFDEDEEEIEKD